MAYGKLVRLLALAPALLFWGCASMLVPGEMLDSSIRSYQQMIRWQEPNGAAAFVEPEHRAEYLERVAALDKIKIVEYEIKRVELTDKDMKAQVTVEFKYHHLDSIVVKSVVDEQRWEYESEGKQVGWHLITLPPEFP